MGEDMKLEAAIIDRNISSSAEEVISEWNGIFSRNRELLRGYSKSTPHDGQ